MTPPRYTYMGGDTRYGWDADGAPVAHEQAVIALARAARARGLSLRRVGGVLSRLGRTPRLGGAWNPNQIRRMLAP